MVIHSLTLDVLLQLASWEKRTVREEEKEQEN